MAPDGEASKRAEPKSAALRLAEEVQRRPFAAAAIATGAAAATAGAFLGARALARRNGAGPLNAVLENAITASEAAAACSRSESPEDPAQDFPRPAADAGDSGDSGGGGSSLG